MEDLSGNQGGFINEVASFEGTQFVVMEKVSLNITSLCKWNYPHTMMKRKAFTENVSWIPTTLDNFTAKWRNPYSKAFTENVSWIPTTLDNFTAKWRNPYSSSNMVIGMQDQD